MDDYLAYYMETGEDVLAHYGIQGMKWGVRRYQNPDGSLTAAGRQRYGVGPARDSSPSESEAGLLRTTSSGSKRVDAVGLGKAGSVAEGIGAGALAAAGVYAVSSVASTAASLNLSSPITAAFAAMGSPVALAAVGALGLVGGVVQGYQDGVDWAVRINAHLDDRERRRSANS